MFVVRVMDANAAGAAGATRLCVWHDSLPVRRAAIHMTTAHASPACGSRIRLRVAHRVLAAHCLPGSRILHSLPPRYTTLRAPRLPARSAPAQGSPAHACALTCLILMYRRISYVLLLGGFCRCLFRAPPTTMPGLDVLTDCLRLALFRARVPTNSFLPYAYRASSCPPPPSAYAFAITVCTLLLAVGLFIWT